MEMNNFLRNLSYPDWFLLDTLGDNLNQMSFEDLIHAIDEKLSIDDRPWTVFRLSDSSSPPPRYNGKDLDQKDGKE